MLSPNWGCFILIPTYHHYILLLLFKVGEKAQWKEMFAVCLCEYICVFFGFNAVVLILIW